MSDHNPNAQKLWAFSIGIAAGAPIATGAGYWYAMAASIIVLTVGIIWDEVYD